MFLGTLSFLPQFPILQSGFIDLHAQNTYGEGGGSWKKSKRPLHWQIVRAGAKKRTPQYIPVSPCFLEISQKTLQAPSLGMLTADRGAVKHCYSFSCLLTMHSNKSNSQNILPGRAKIIFLTPSISRVAKVVGKLWKRKLFNNCTRF